VGRTGPGSCFAQSAVARVGARRTKFSAEAERRWKMSPLSPVVLAAIWLALTLVLTTKRAERFPAYLFVPLLLAWVAIAVVMANQLYEAARPIHLFGRWIIR